MKNASIYRPKQARILGIAPNDIEIIFSFSYFFNQLQVGIYFMYIAIFTGIRPTEHNNILFTIRPRVTVVTFRLTRWTKS